MAIRIASGQDTTPSAFLLLTPFVQLQERVPFAMAFLLHFPGLSVSRIQTTTLLRVRRKTLVPPLVGSPSSSEANAGENGPRL